MTEPDHKPRPKIKALAGMRPHELHACVPETVRTGDRPLPNRPARPCSRCGRTFEPTLKRRMLCKGCFSGGDGGGLAA